ncbi:hypothetical protein D0A39_10065 [Xanthomonas campestris pv. campestris]|nr:hypothetical protein D0A39_10065 [Xanthomonas campestris pv. campestris]
MLSTWRCSFSHREKVPVGRMRGASETASACDDKRVATRLMSDASTTSPRPPTPAPRPGPRLRRGRSKARAPMARKPCLLAPAGEGL